jgi:hypothetical protein
MDALTFLKNDHDRVNNIFRSFAKDGDKSHPIFALNHRNFTAK